MSASDLGPEFLGSRPVGVSLLVSELEKDLTTLQRTTKPSTASPLQVPVSPASSVNLRTLSMVSNVTTAVLMKPNSSAIASTSDGGRGETADLEEDDETTGKGKHVIVARGYDKFFNIGEVPWNSVSPFNSAPDCRHNVQQAQSYSGPRLRNTQPVPITSHSNPMDVSSSSQHCPPPKSSSHPSTPSVLEKRVRLVMP